MNSRQLGEVAAVQQVVDAAATVDVPEHGVITRPGRWWLADDDRRRRWRAVARRGAASKPELRGYGGGRAAGREARL